ncbi:hypothetical protein Prudu_278S000200 [Prunus dulcis]|uniref:Uncharacterized protein n=1 Tax=Prunus dulcis TaxID=3755 RepID=A0A5H2XLK1_PRUDU|nr:hypothetical protein Prudu_278S000200 [Prunus dulcis]
MDNIESGSIIYMDKMSGGSESDDCVTAKWEEGHNHKMTPQKNAFIKIPSYFRFYKVSIFEVQSGGMDKIGFIKKDIYNLECSVNGKLRNHDVELVTELREMAMTGLVDVFWADATSRRAYGFYGDVVVFDINSTRIDTT